jgi:tetratricopeptide (TPR) repeat protein
MSDSEYDDLISLGKKAREEGRFNEALGFFEKAIALDPEIPRPISLWEMLTLSWAI